MLVLSLHLSRYIFKSKDKYLYGIRKSKLSPSQKTLNLPNQNLQQSQKFKENQRSINTQK